MFGKLLPILALLFFRTSLTQNITSPIFLDPKRSSPSTTQVIFSPIQTALEVLQRASHLPCSQSTSWYCRPQWEKCSLLTTPLPGKDSVSLQDGPGADRYIDGVTWGTYKWPYNWLSLGLLHTYKWSRFTPLITVFVGPLRYYDQPNSAEGRWSWRRCHTRLVPKHHGYQRPAIAVPTTGLLKTCRCKFLLVVGSS